MTIQRMDHVGVVVEDLDAASAFFTDLGLDVVGGGTVGDERVDRIVGLEGVECRFAMVEAPEGRGRLELIEFATPAARDGDAQAPANTRGLRHVAFEVDDIEATVARAQAGGAELVGEIVRYGNSFFLCYLRGPAGIIVELAEKVR